MKDAAAHNEKSDFQKNRELLNLCKTVDTAICIIYFIMCSFTFLYTFFHIFLFGLETIFLLLFGITANFVIFFLGYWGCYKKNVILSAAAPAVALLSGLICLALDAALGKELLFISLEAVGGFNVGTAIFGIFLLILNVYNVSRFEYVRKQPGYPYFNDLIEKQKEEHRQFEIKSEYEKTYERLSGNKVEKTEENAYRYSTDSSKPAQMDEI